MVIAGGLLWRSFFIVCLYQYFLARQRMKWYYKSDLLIQRQYQVTNNQNQAKKRILQ